jgi:hypothetical protein
MSGIITTEHLKRFGDVCPRDRRPQLGPGVQSDEDTTGSVLEYSLRSLVDLQEVLVSSSAVRVQETP